MQAQLFHGQGYHKGFINEREKIREENHKDEGELAQKRQALGAAGMLL
jgi:hypothetical protein